MNKMDEYEYSRTLPTERLAGFYDGGNTRHGGFLSAVALLHILRQLSFLIVHFLLLQVVAIYLSAVTPFYGSHNLFPLFSLS